MNGPRPQAVVTPTSGGRETGALEFLAELSRSLAASLDLHGTLTRAITQLRDYLEVEGIALFLLDPEQPVLECQVCAGPVDVTGMRLAVGQGIVGRALAEDATQRVADASADARVWRAADEATGFVTRSLACAPLRSAAGPIGVIEIVNRRDGQPFTREDERLLELVAAPAALAINNARMATALLAQQRLKREFDLARHLQKSLLPRRRRGAFPVLGVNRPAHEMSGDFYDYFDLPDGRIGFFIGDVSGKGLDAALLMVRAASLLRWIGKEGPAPAAWLERANEELWRSARDGRFVCALVGYCDPGATRVQIANAGFPPALVQREGHWSQHLAGGPPLGVLGDSAFEQEEIALAGGALYAFSDGATDVHDASGGRLGVAGVQALLAAHLDQAPGARLRAVLGALKRMRLVDDTTLLLVAPPGAEAAELLLARELPAHAEEMRSLRVALREVFDAHGIEPLLRDRLVLAVDEACTNIIRHGYGADCTGTIRIRVLRQGACLEIELRDQAPCVDPARLAPGTLGQERCGGLGIALIDQIMDEWRVEALRGGGNRLLLRKQVPAWASEEAEGT